MLQVISIILLIVIMMSIVEWGRRRFSRKAFVIFILAMFSLYALGQLYCTLFSRVPGAGFAVELNPFMSIIRLFTKPIEASGEVTGLLAWFMRGAPPGTGIILNILLFVPLGYLVEVLMPNWKSRYVTLLGCVCSIAIELMQYFFKMGFFETDDILYNTLGTAIGVWIWHLQSKRLNKQNSNELPKE